MRSADALALADADDPQPRDDSLRHRDTHALARAHEAQRPGGEDLGRGREAAEYAALAKLRRG